jgi:hypothetical protein
LSRRRDTPRSSPSSAGLRLERLLVGLQALADEAKVVAQQRQFAQQVF